MRQKTVGEVVRAAVRVRIRVDSALQQAQPQNVSMHAVAVLAVGEKGHAVVGLGQVCKALPRYFESGLLPARVAVCRTVDGAELDFIGRPPVAKTRWEGDLEQRLTLLPFDVGDEINPRRSRIHRQTLNDAALLA